MADHVVLRKAEAFDQLSSEMVELHEIALLHGCPADEKLIPWACRELRQAFQRKSAFNRVTRAAWRLATWNDHNFTDEDYRRWRMETQAACKAVEPHLTK